MYDPRWGDPRERDDDPRDVEIHWIELGRGSDPREDDPRDRDEDARERDRDTRERDHDPRDVFLRDLDLPRGLEGNRVLDEVFGAREDAPYRAVWTDPPCRDRLWLDDADGVGRVSGVRHHRAEGRMRNPGEAGIRSHSQRAGGELGSQVGGDTVRERA